MVGVEMGLWAIYCGPLRHSLALGTGCCGIEPVSSAWAGGFFTTEPHEKPLLTANGAKNDRFSVFMFEHALKALDFYQRFSIP